MTYILGSGLSGLSFSYFNKKKNIIFEKNDFVGGRIQSKQFLNNFVEGGAQFYSKEDPNIYGLIKELKLEKEEIPVSLNNFCANRNSELISIKNGESKQLSIEEKRQIKTFKEKITETLPLVESFPEDLIKISFEEWYKKTIGKESIWLINGMMRAITFTEPRNQSALYGIIVCGTFFSTCYSLTHGLKMINEKLIKLSNPNIMLNQKVEFINLHNEISTSILVNNKLKKVKNGLASCLPSNVLTNSIDKSELSKKIKKISYNGCAVLILETDKRLLNNDSGILYTNPKDLVAVLIDESEYYNFKNKKNIIGLLFPYKKRLTEKMMINTAIKKINEINNIDFNIENKSIYYWDYGLPEFNYKNYSLQNNIKEIMKNYKNFAICGDFMGLPSLDACVESAKDAAIKLQ